MATYNSVDTFRDPRQVDIMSTLGQAMTYLQKNYDTNVAETQSLINQYVGMDLLRDVDKQYLNSRLTTLVDYVNKSGTRNWTKSSVAKDVQNYISTALDSNVMSAVASTQAYRKQMAEIEGYKKSGKGEYSIQNEWAATQDLARYMKSDKLGDVYRAGTYVPYKDVQGKILKNLSTLKDFGVEYVPFSQDYAGGGYFKMVGTREVLSPAKVSQYLSAILDAGDMQQLQIDGMYNAKDLKPEQITEKYLKTFDKRISALDDNISEAKGILAGEVDPVAKKTLEANIKFWETEKQNNISEKASASKLDPSTMAGRYHMNNFFDNYSNFLSFNRIKDWKIDDSMFKIQQEITKIKMHNDDLGYKYWAKNQDIAMAQEDNRIKLATAGLKSDGKGGFIADPNNPLGAGLAMHQDATTLQETEVTDPISKNIKEFEDLYSDMRGGQFIKDLKNHISTSGEDIKNTYGNQKDGYLVGMLINSSSPTSPGNALYESLPPELKMKVDQARSLKTRVDDTVDSHLKGKGGIFDTIKEVSNALPTSAEFYKRAINDTLGGYKIDDKGNLVKGDVSTSKGKYADVAKTVAIMQAEIRNGELSDDEKAVFERGIKLKLANSGLSSSQVNAVLSKLKSTYTPYDKGNFQKAGSHYLNTIDSLGKLWRGEGNVFGNAFDAVTSGIKGNIRGLMGLTGISEKDPMGAAKKLGLGTVFGPAGVVLSDTLFNPNQSMSTLGDSNFFGINGKDLNVKGSAEVPYSKLKEQLNTIKTKSQNVMKKSILGNTLKIDPNNKASKPLADAIRLALPPEAQIDSNGYYSIKPNTDDPKGHVDIVVSQKVGKNYEAVTHKIPVSNLPSTLVNQIEAKDTNSIYDASNPYAVRPSGKVRLPENILEANEQRSKLSLEQQLSMPPSMTQQQLMVIATEGVPKELVEKHAGKIKEIVESTYDVQMVPLQGQWVAQVNRNGKLFMNVPTGESEYNPENMKIVLPEVVTQSIVNTIRSLTMY